MNPNEARNRAAVAARDASALTRSPVLVIAGGGSSGTLLVEICQADDGTNTWQAGGVYAIPATYVGPPVQP